MSVNSSSSSSRITDAYLRQLTQVNANLTNAFDSELEKLKSQERELKEAMRLKTRLNLLNQLERELQLEDLSELNGLGTRVNLLNSLTASGEMNAGQNLDEMIELSDESLRKSYGVLDKLESNRKRTSKHLHDDGDGDGETECRICEYPVDDSNRSRVDTTQFLRNTVYGNLGNSTRRAKSLYFNTPEPVRPNVVSLYN